MSQLDLLGVNVILKDGVEISPTRKKLNFIGDGVTITDDSAAERTNITITSTGDTGTVTGPETSTAGHVATFAGADGTVIADSGVAVAGLATTTAVSTAISSAVTTALAGRNLATDGAKLDGIEAGAQVTSFSRVSTALAAASADIAVNGHKITGLADPTGPQDADTKAARDAAIAAAATSGWQSAIDVNLTQDANFTFVNGNNTWHGLVWTGENIAAAASQCAVVNGTGFVLHCNTANTAWYYSSDNAPKIWISLASLIPSFRWGASELRIAAQFDVAGTTQYDLGGIAIEKAFVANQAWTHKIYAGYVPGYTRYAQVLMEASEGSNNSFDSTHKVNFLHLRNLTHCAYGSRPTSALDTDPNSSVFDQSDYTLGPIWSAYSGPAGATVGALHIPRVRKTSDARIVIAAQTGNTNGNCALTIKRLRIEYKN